MLVLWRFLDGNWLEEQMKAAFGGVMKMLTGKNFYQKTGALRIVVEQVLHQILSEVNTTYAGTES